MTADELAKSISGLCQTVIARRLGQFFEVIGEELRKEKTMTRRRCVGCGATEGFTSPLNLCQKCEQSMQSPQNGSAHV